jgi:DNA replication ATP-dependent helicase Dna2
MMRRLADAMPVAVSRLSLQYRMHKDICDLCNEIIYKGDLKCANEQVSKALLTLENFPMGLPKIQNRAFTSHPQKSFKSFKSDEQGWLHRVIDPSSVVVFADTDSINSDHKKSYDIKNETISAIAYLEKSLSKGASRVRGRTGVTNYAEVELIRLTVKAFISCGLNVSEIGVISPFRSQVNGELFSAKNVLNFVSNFSTSLLFIYFSDPIDARG